MDKVGPNSSDNIVSNQGSKEKGIEQGDKRDQIRHSTSQPIVQQEPILAAGPVGPMVVYREPQQMQFDGAKNRNTRLSLAKGDIVHSTRPPDGVVADMQSSHHAVLDVFDRRTGTNKLGSWEDSDKEILVKTLEPRLGAEDRVTMKLD